MRMLIAACMALIVSPAAADGWKFETREDPMTDALEYKAGVINEDAQAMILVACYPADDHVTLALRGTKFIDDRVEVYTKVTWRIDKAAPKSSMFRVWKSGPTTIDRDVISEIAGSILTAKDRFVAQVRGHPPVGFSVEGASVAISKALTPCNLTP